jgi:hypothetical protein
MGHLELMTLAKVWARIGGWLSEAAKPAARPSPRAD